ncbi:LysR family transcriptional regulator [Laribacter hongkongensis]|uniref:LysR substrate-binding domain-containing protein n=1 Tax=Laribacter hongkongensis TaxID=168471 RepID=UPI001EFC77C6|nr:LysR substrate-binding domain-containing protein [Laribacter hongkongensis]MCG8992037.1 LysR family transcriptional regulator [Laribacter hongkongensis]MCG8998664.1 LysR family transcriptional regulator [Laribacter hongkongensis]MCG9002017.1 LysR family transcriptional regulator [Laribacter hongkongensis]MCG9005274.1 LysR family transcriptional regulator [Laribacter hongkongensis]MCG9008676.1 LysR family transcriptional regulator [Laribacter hongkongensis]
MELRHLRYFIAVAEELHFTRAAQRLNIGQPPLSQQIRALEQEIGASLFERTQRRVSLTPAGEHLLLRARAILADCDAAVAEAARIARGESGELRIGFTSSAPLMPLLSRLLQAFRASRPQVRLSLSELFTTRQFDALLHRELDVGLVRDTGLQVPAGLALIPLQRDRLNAVLPSQHPLAHRPGISLAELAGEAFIAHPPQTGSGLRRLIRQLCHEAGFEPLIQQESTEAITQIGLVAAGMGVAILPEQLASVHLPGAVHVPIHDDNAVVSMALACRQADNNQIVQEWLRIAVLHSQKRHTD